jgi:hypothetical protein
MRNTAFRVLRGGSYFVPRFLCRSIHDSYSRDIRSRDFGFRLVIRRSKWA